MAYDNQGFAESVMLPHAIGRSLLMRPARRKRTKDRTYDTSVHFCGIFCMSGLSRNERLNLGAYVFSSGAPRMLSLPSKSRRIKASAGLDAGRSTPVRDNTPGPRLRLRHPRNLGSGCHSPAQRHTLCCGVSSVLAAQEIAGQHRLP